MVGVMIWASGARPFRSTRGYKIKMDFPTACGIGPGTPVRIRGVRVGTAISGTNVAASELLSLPP